jgi:hypothetical protein
MDKHTDIIFKVLFLLCSCVPVDSYYILNKTSETRKAKIYKFVYGPLLKVYHD